MNPFTLLNPENLSQLSYYSSKKGQIVIIITWIIPPTLLLLAVNNFFQASATAQAGGLDFRSIIHSYLSGVNTYGNYTGSYVSAIQQLGSGFLNMAIGFTFLLGSVFYHKQGRLNTKVLETLKKLETFNIQEK
jgi:hypothetical protein